MSGLTLPIPWQYVQWALIISAVALLPVGLYLVFRYSAICNYSGIYLPRAEMPSIQYRPEEPRYASLPKYHDVKYPSLP